jgi:serine/threonine protein kinase
VLEALPDGSLQQVKKRRKLPEKETAAIVKQVSLGLKYMHEEYIIHRDLKPENLFVNDVLSALFRDSSKLVISAVPSTTGIWGRVTRWWGVWSIPRRSS